MQYLFFFAVFLASMATASSSFLQNLALVKSFQPFTFLELNKAFRTVYDFQARRLLSARGGTILSKFQQKIYYICIIYLFKVLPIMRRDFKVPEVEKKFFFSKNNMFLKKILNKCLFLKKKVFQAKKFHFD